MPTNLPPEYFKAEERYRAARTAKEKIAALEELLRIVPKHKGTDKLRGDLKRRLAKLKESGQKKGGASRQVSPFAIEREGAGQVVLIGPPNSGKSSLLAATTRAAPEVAAFPFTTWTPTQGMLEFEQIKIQLIDTPPLQPEYLDPELVNLIRRADLAVLVLDLQAGPLNQLEAMQSLLQEKNILLQASAPRTAAASGSRDLPVLLAANKDDDEGLDEDLAILGELVGEGWPLIGISAASGRNLEAFKHEVFTRLGVIRVFSKAPGKEPDLTEPFVLKAGSTVQDLAVKLHRDFGEKLKSARIWGQGVYEGQLVGREHLLNDLDVVELRL